MHPKSWHLQEDAPCPLICESIDDENVDSSEEKRRKGEASLINSLAYILRCLSQVWRCFFTIENDRVLTISSNRGPVKDTLPWRLAGLLSPSASFL